MKKLLALCVMMAGVFTCSAQTVIDRFELGPYIVEYYGQDDVRYRLQDNVNLYEFFDLKMDTTIISKTKEVEVPLDHAIAIAGNIGANRKIAKEIGVEGVWKQLVGKNLYFNGGLSLNFGITHYGKNSGRSMVEIGIPLQIELGKLNHQNGSLYGSFGLTPAFYSTMTADGFYKTKVVDGKTVLIDPKKSGFLLTPSLEFGGNIPVGPTILRIGVYAKYKINCTPGDFDVYTKGGAGRMFLGAKIGFVL